MNHIIPNRGIHFRDSGQPENALGMEVGLHEGGIGFVLFALCAASLAGFALLSMVAVWRAARRHPGVGASFAVVFALVQALLMIGDVGLTALSAIGPAISPVDLLGSELSQAAGLMRRSP